MLSVVFVEELWWEGLPDMAEKKMRESCWQCPGGGRLVKWFWERQRQALFGAWWKRPKRLPILSVHCKPYSPHLYPH